MFCVGQGPVEAVVVSERGVPGEGFAAVVASAERIHVGSGGWTVWLGLMMIKVAAVCRYGAAGEAAAAGADLDRFGEPGGGVAAEFGDLEEPATVIGEEPGDQHLVAAAGPMVSTMCCLSVSPWMNPDRSASSAGLSVSRLDNGTTTALDASRNDTLAVTDSAQVVDIPTNCNDHRPSGYQSGH